MTITAAPPEADVASGFEALGVFLAANPAVSRRIPARTVNIPLKGKTAAERIDELHAIARETGGVVEWHEGGFLAVTVQFGGVTLEAHHNPASFLIVQGAQRKAAA